MVILLATAVLNGALLSIFCRCGAHGLTAGAQDGGDRRRRGHEAQHLWRNADGHIPGEREASTLS